MATRLLRGGAPCPPFQHAEAFCLMKYASRDGEAVEWIWNSRDGVTPFGLRARDGETELAHVDWELDRFIPYYRPQPGERVFVSITRADAEATVRAQIEAYWDDPEWPMSATYPDREAACERLMKDALRDVQQGAPKVVFAREWLAAEGRSWQSSDHLG